jgi:uncharacterized protein with ParB-like and HNH nuclease domain
MDVNNRSLNQIFDPTEQRQAPLFQRPYVWKRERNWQPLWESIESIANKRVDGVVVYPHFLGTIVLDQVRNSSGTISKRQIIDGQQRLTTLQLALAAIRDICRAAGDEGFERSPAFQEAFAKLTDNHVPLSRETDDVLKVYPTNADRPHFREVMKAGSQNAVQRIIENDGGGEALIPNAYLYFYETISGWLGSPKNEDFEHRLTMLYGVIKDDLNLVVLDLDEKDNAQVIFETLNALGAPLLPADLVKNFLFQNAKYEGLDTEALYYSFWHPFDKYQKYWRMEITQGRFKRPRLDLFLQNYLTLVTGEEAIATQLFTVFRDYVKDSGIPTAKQLENFRAYAKVYWSFGGFSDDTQEGLFFYRLEQLDTTTVYPLLLEVFRTENLENNRDDVLRVCRVLESYFVRRTICELSTRNYNRIFLDLIKKLREQKDFSSAAISRALVEHTADFAKFPTDEEFKQAWLGIRIYKRLAQKKTRMILEALNSAMHTGKTEEVYIKEKLTIEHLMPQGWKTHWVLPADVTPEQRDRLVQNIGNLTLLTKSLNPSISNNAWSVKRPAILQNSVLNMNNRFYNVEEWNEDSINERAQKLFDIAVEVWPYPNS